MRLYSQLIITFWILQQSQQQFCPQNCDECTNNNCTKCSDGYIFDSQQSVCSFKCLNNLFYLIDTDKCVTICPFDYTPDLNSGVCTKISSCSRSITFGNSLMNGFIIQNVVYNSMKNQIYGFFNKDQYIRIWDVEQKYTLFKQKLFENPVMGIKFIYPNPECYTHVNNYNFCSMPILFIWDEEMALKMLNMNQVFELKHLGYKEDGQNIYTIYDIFKSKDDFNKFCVFLFSSSSIKISTLEAINDDQKEQNPIEVQFIGSDTIVDLYIVESDLDFVIYYKNKIEFYQFQDYYLKKITQPTTISECSTYKNVSSGIKAHLKLYDSQSDKYLFLFVSITYPNTLFIHSNVKCIDQIIFSDGNVIQLNDKQVDQKNFFLVILKTKLIIYQVIFKDNSFNFEKFKDFDLGISSQFQWVNLLSYTFTFLDSDNMVSFINLSQDLTQFNVINRISSINKRLYLSIGKNTNSIQAIFFGESMEYFSIDESLKTIQPKTQIQNYKQKVLQLKTQVLALVEIVQYPYYYYISSHQDSVLRIWNSKRKSHFLDIILPNQMNGYFLNYCYLNQFLFVYASSSPQDKPIKDDSVIFIYRIQTFELVGKFNQPQLFSFILNIKLYYFLASYQEFACIQILYSQQQFIKQISSIKINNPVQVKLLVNNIVFICDYDFNYLIEFQEETQQLKILNKYSNSGMKPISANVDEKLGLISIGYAYGLVVVFQISNLMKVHDFSLNKDEVCYESVFRSSDILICNVYNPLKTPSFQFKNIYFTDNIAVSFFSYINANLRGAQVQLYDYQKDNFYGVIFTKALPQASSFNIISMSTKQGSTSYYSLNSFYFSLNICRSFQINYETNNILFGCDGGVTCQRPIPNFTEYPIRASIQIQNGKFQQILYKLYILILYSGTQVEFICYKTYKSLLFYTLTIPNEKFLQFIECQNDNKIIMITSHKFKILERLDINVKTVKEFQLFPDVVTGIVYIEQKQLMYCFGNFLFYAKLIDENTFSFNYLDKQPNQQYDCKKNKENSSLLICVQVKKGIEINYISILTYDIQSNELIKIQEDSTMYLYDGFLVDERYSTIIMYGNEIHIYQIYGVIQVFSEKLLNRLKKITFTEKHILGFSINHYVILPRNNINGQVQIFQKNYEGILLGYEIIEWTNQFVYYTTDISLGQFTIIDLKTANIIARQFFGNINETISDMKADPATMALVIKFKKGTVYRARLDFSFFVDLSIYYPSFSQDNKEDGVMLERFLLDKVFLRLIFIFDNYFLFYDYNQYIDTFIPFQKYQNQYFSKITTSNDPEKFMNVFVDNTNNVWIADRGVETIRQIYQHQEQIQNIVLIYSFNNITYVGIFSYQKSYILIIDTLKNDSQVYMTLDKIQIQVFLLQNKNDKTRHDLAIIDNLNTLTIIDIISKNVQEIQLDCRSYYSNIYKEDKGYLIILCVDAKVFILDVKQKILNSVYLQQTDACISIQEFNDLIFIGLNNGNLFVIEVIQSSNEGYQFGNSHQIKIVNDDISIFNLLIYWDFNQMRVLIRSKYNKIFNTFKITINRDANNKIQSINAIYLINVLISRDSIEEIFFRDGFMFVAYQNIIEYYNSTTYQYYDRTSMEMNYIITLKYEYISKYILIISNQQKIQVYQICEKNKKIFLLTQYESITNRFLSVDKWNSQDTNNNRINQIAIIYDQQDSIQIEFISPHSQQILEKLTQDQNQQQILSMINKCQANFKINSIPDFQQEATQIQTTKQTPMILLNLSEQTFFHDILFKLNDKIVTLYTDSFRIVNLEKQSLTVITAQHINLCNLTLTLYNDFQAVYSRQVQKMSLQNLNIVGSTNENNKYVFDQKIKYLIRNSTISWDQKIHVNWQNVTLRYVQLEQMYYFISVSNLTQFYIENLIFEYCYFKDMINVFQIQNVQQFYISNVIFKNCYFQNVQNIFSIQQNQDVQFKLFQFISNFNENINQYTLAVNSTGNVRFEINSSFFYNNTNFQLINTQRQFNQIVNNEIEIVTLKIDYLIFYNNTFHKNLCDMQLEGLISLSNSDIKLSNLNISSNICKNCQGTFQIPLSESLKFYDSTFVGNSAFDGGAIYAFFVNEFILINTNFTDNQAVRNGGAIYVFLEKISLTDTYFINNTATIGGAIRQIEIDKSPLISPNLEYFKDNKAILYGNNIGFFPLKLTIEINIQESDLDPDIKNSFILIDKDLSKKQIKSGSKIDLIVSFYDHDERKIQFNYNQLDQQYQKVIDGELNQHSINIKIPQQSKDTIQLQGMKIKNLLEAYDKQTNQFLLKNILVIGELQSCGTIEVTSSIFNQDVLETFAQDAFLELKFCFRLCKQGEIPIIYSNNLYICIECEEGTFSFFEMQNKKSFYNENEEVKCKKCPLGAKSCQKNEIYLQNECIFKKNKMSYN